MSITVPLPFNITPTATGSLALSPEQVASIRSVIAGRDTSISRVRAISVLGVSDVPDKHRDFRRLLEDERELPKIRRLAAINLGRINTRAAAEILIQNSYVREESVLAGVMKALGRIGDRSALPAISRVEETATGLAASQAHFAAALISHRLGLQGNDLPVADRQQLLELQERYGHTFQVTQATMPEAELCLRSLAAQPFGIEFSEQMLYQVRCGRNVWMLLVNRDFAGTDAVRKLQEQKAFPGVVATKSQEDGSYAIAFLVLTSPDPQANTVHILIHRSTGGLVFGGMARIQGNQAEFSIRASSRPGAFPVQIEGSFLPDGKLEFKTALSSLSVQNPRQPTKERY